MPEETKPETPSPDQAAAKPAPATPEGEAAPPARPPRAVGKTYFWGTGRRKTSVARVRIRPGGGAFQVNGKELKDYFGVERHRLQAIMPLTTANLASRVDVYVNVHGGGPNSQAGATLMGVARALVRMDQGLGMAMRAKGFLTRDSREVERKKYGRAGARRSFQFSKR